MYEEVIKCGKIEVNECGVHDNEVGDGGMNDGGGNEEEVNERGVDDSKVNIGLMNEGDIFGIRSDNDSDDVSLNYYRIEYNT